MVTTQLCLPPNLASRIEDLESKREQLAEYEELERLFQEELEGLKAAQDTGDVQKELMHAKAAAMCKHALRNKSHVLAWGDSDNIIQEEIALLLEYIAFND